MPDPTPLNAGWQESHARKPRCCDLGCCRVRRYVIIALMSSVRCAHTSDDIPCVFGGMTKFAACHASAQAVVAYADGLVFEAVRKVVLSFCHCPNKDTDAFVGDQRVYVIPYSHHFSIEAECNLSTRWRQVVGDGVLDDLEKLFLRVH